MVVSGVQPVVVLEVQGVLLPIQQAQSSLRVETARPERLLETHQEVAVVQLSSRELVQ
jgi:hypothetical protein